jgi:hypothetical protein
LNATSIINIIVASGIVCFVLTFGIGILVLEGMGITPSPSVVNLLFTGVGALAAVFTGTATAARNSSGGNGTTAAKGTP